jgi:dTDP-L-rhamnose 4-epimerase
MGKRVLLLGGMGFIGSHVCDELIAAGHKVCVYDCLDPQVHGPAPRVPAYLNPEARIIIADVRDRERLRPLLAYYNVVIHLAAKVGVGQSAYEMGDYISCNSWGTAVLLDELAKQPSTKLIVASSMSVYGEGAQDVNYDINSDDWATYQPIPTDEDKPVDLQSIYALTKYDQERLCLLFGRAYKVPTIALRFFNVYGPRQSLNNPYTGALAIFASRLLNNHPPVIFEDGQQRRDFVYVTDIARAVRLALESDISDEVINIGSGSSVTILQLAERLAQALGSDLEPVVTGEHRVGDIRHCFADISKARRLLGYEPQVDLDEGIQRTVEWLRTQTAVDKFDQHHAELHDKGLLA